MFGFLPPSSSETFLNNGAAASATFFPVTVPPVNEMVLIFGWAVIAAPTFGPVPWTTLSTPLGSPASTQISHNKYAVIGVSSLVLSVAVFFYPDSELFLGRGYRKSDLFLASVGVLRVRLAGRGFDFVEKTSGWGFKKFTADKIQNGRVSHDELDRNIERFLD